MAKENPLIVGAGPTGLTLALAFLRRNVATKILDEKEGPSLHSKALAIHPRTLELFAKLGVASELIRKGRKAHSITLHHNEKEYALKIDHLDDTPYPFILVLPQSSTEKILIDAIQKSGGEIQWNSKIVALDGQEAITSNGQQIAFDWLIGCDGAKSTIRHLLHLDFAGYELQEKFLIIDVEGTSMARDSSPHFFLSKQGLLGMIAFEERVSRLIIPMRKNEQILKSIDSIDAVLEKRGCKNFLHPEKIVWFSNFMIHRRIVSKMRKGNCFLAGDAAHIHSPAGGQGMNTSIQDAYNLAWKLDLVMKGQAKGKILESYENERLPIARKVLKGTTLFTKLLTFVQKTRCYFILFTILFFINNFFKKTVVRGLTELSYRYGKNSMIKEPFLEIFWRGPKCGERAPNVKLADGRDFFDYLNHEKFIVLLFEESLTCKNELIDILVLKDINLQKAYHASSNSIYIIRPDGVIGYRARKLKEKEITDYFNFFTTEIQCGRFRFAEE